MCDCGVAMHGSKKMTKLKAPQKARLKEHSKKHSKKHMASMRMEMMRGKSFKKAHRHAQQKHGK